MSQVGENIRIEREKLHLSQNQLAKKAGVAQATINAIERSTKSPSVDTIQMIADALHVTVGYLLGETSMEDVSGLLLSERQLIHLFRQLNDEGQEIVFKTALMAQNTYPQISAGEGDPVPRGENLA